MPTGARHVSRPDGAGEPRRIAGERPPGPLAATGLSFCARLVGVERQTSSSASRGRVPQALSVRGRSRSTPDARRPRRRPAARPRAAVRAGDAGDAGDAGGAGGRRSLALTA